MDWSIDQFILLFFPGFLPLFGPSFINFYGSTREYSDLPDEYDDLNLGIVSVQLFIFFSFSIMQKGTFFVSTVEHDPTLCTTFQFLSLFGTGPIPTHWCCEQPTIVCQGFLVKLLPSRCTPGKEINSFYS